MSDARWYVVLGRHGSRTRICGLSLRKASRALRMCELLGIPVDCNLDPLVLR